MRSIKVVWSNEDLKSELSRLGYEPTQANINKVKENRLVKTMEEAMTQAGWDAMTEVIMNAMQE